MTKGPERSTDGAMTDAAQGYKVTESIPFSAFMRRKDLLDQQRRCR
jgi:hypothetical protein